MEVKVDNIGLPAQTRDGWVRGQELSPERRFIGEKLKRIAEDQLGRYPRRMLERIGLKQIVLCDRLTFDGTPCPAFADVEHGRVFVNAGGEYGADYFVRTIHHEIFHQVDYADDKTLETDPRWEALNPPGFHYRRDKGQSPSDLSEMTPDDQITGFISRYATTNPAEDKAEVFAWLVVDHDNVRWRADHDEVLRRKVSRIEAMLELFGPFKGVVSGSESAGEVSREERRRETPRSAKGVARRVPRGS